MTDADTLLTETQTAISNAAVGLYEQLDTLIEVSDRLHACPPSIITLNESETRLLVMCVDLARMVLLAGNLAALKENADG